MSSTQETNVETVKVPRTKKPSLSGKYSKFLSFGFWFVNQFDGLEQEVRDAMYSRMKLFDTVDAQSEFFQAFLDDIKPSNKLMRAAITAHNKPPKAPRAPKEPKEPKAKKTKGKSAAEAVEAHVDQLVADLANTAQAETAQAETAQAEPAPKKTKKTKAAKTETAQAETAQAETAQAETAQAEAETLQSEPVAETTNETQPVQKKTKKAKAAKKTKNSEVAPPQNEEADLETRIIHISDTEQYLIDNENRLYDMESHVEIGFFDTNTNAVHLM